MKPISIELQAFGPFAGTEIIDFENLSKDGLFLIRGKTGSGKSMILDAISFALFGKSSGENRDNLEDLRCNRCDPDMDTFVRFAFEEKGGMYIFERALRKGRKNLNSKSNAFRINEEGVEVPIFDNPKEREVTRKAEEIIGLSYDQFRQVIILPQGKFEKLLTSRSEDKEKILSSIFGTEKWQIMADNYYNRAKAEKDRLNEIKNRIESRLADEDCRNIEELKEKALYVARSRDEEEKSFREKDYDAKERKLNEQKDICTKFAELRNLQERKKELEGKAESIEKDRIRLKMADMAEPFRKPLEEKAKASGHLSMRRSEEEKSETLRNQAEKRAEEAAERLDKHHEKNEEYEGWKKDYADFESKKPVYEKINEASEKMAEAKDRHRKYLDELAEMQEKRDQQLAETEELYRRYEESIETHKAALDSYMNGIKGFMAEKLEEGAPCPVCGSTNHPRKAAVPKGTASMEYVNLLEKTRDTRKENWANANDSRIQIEKELDEKRKEEADLKTAADLAEADYGRVTEELVEGIETLDQLNDRLVDLKYSISRHEIDGRKLEEAVRSAQLALKGAQTTLDNASAERKKAEENYREAETVCEELIAGSDFESTEEAEQAMISTEERREITNAAGEYEGQLLEITGIVKNKQSQLKGADEPDIDFVRSELKLITEEREQFNKSQGALIREIERINGKTEALESEMETYEGEIQKAESDFIFAKSLRGDTGIGLQRYVLGIMFSSVIAAANEMLAKVHGGRYRLYRTDKKIAGSNKKGLDLKVHDSYSDRSEGRTVSTLSGGEKFLASLALSLGMSAVARSGGVHIEGMFIDEGFGTLDENSVEDALDVLKSIRKLNGSVGIISHMEVLGANIPSQILVEKEKETSTIRLV